MEHHDNRAYRPLGLTLAILMALVFFSAFPIIKTYIAWRFANCVNEAGFACGIEGLPFDGLTKFIGFMGVVVFLTAIFAWWGRPAWIRFVFQGSVLLTSFLLILETVMRATGEAALDSTAEVIQDVLRCQVPALLLFALYIVWYCNRAPARAFYRRSK